MANLIITQELAQAIVNYLGQRPHNEVRALIDAILALPVIEDEKPDKAKPKPE